MPRNTASKSRRSSVRRDVAAQRLARARLDAAQAEDEVDLVLGEIVRHLIGGDAVFVEAAQLVPRLEDRDVMAQHGQAMGAGEPRRPAADHGDALAGRRGARWKGCDARGEQMIGRIALQRADIDRLVLRQHCARRPLAQDLGRADPGAGAAEDVLARGW